MCSPHARAIKAAEEMDIVLDEFDDVLLDEDDVTPHQQQAAALKVGLAHFPPFTCKFHARRPSWLRF